jgi:hypothetical protein
MSVLRRRLVERCAHQPSRRKINYFTFTIYKYQLITCKTGACNKNKLVSDRLRLSDFVQERVCCPTYTAHMASISGEPIDHEPFVPGKQLKRLLVKEEESNRHLRGCQF